jgi:hypothetical protein
MIRGQINCKTITHKKINIDVMPTEVDLLGDKPATPPHPPLGHWLQLSV